MHPAKSFFHLDELIGVAC